MPKPFHWTLAAFALFCSLLCIFQSEPARAAGVAEYAMIRFDGMEHSQVVWPDGRVEFIGTLAPDA
jgi:hypothetical protein